MNRLTNVALALTIIACTTKEPAIDTSREPDYSHYPVKGMVPSNRVLHMGIVVKDIEASLDHWTKFLGLEKRPKVSIAEGHSANPTQYRGQPSNAKAKLAFMHLENLEVELIEPIGTEPSHWREFLETKGGGVHHIAFRVKGMEEEPYFENYAKNGLPLVQHGGWDGGEYGYMDGLESLGVMVELIENHEQKK